jgi:soluble lytic murein transglycosylase-like protein
MKKVLGAFALLTLLYGCGGAGYLPYAPDALSPSQIHALVADASAQNGVPEALINAVVMAESDGDPHAISSAGAQGLMQLMPGTAQSCRIDNAFEPQQNVECGAYVSRVLAAYRNY